jgi:hypothetical protein
VVRARVALSRSQAGDAQNERQSMSYAFSHSVHLAYKRFGPYVGRSFFGQRLGQASGRVEGCQRGISCSKITS